MPEVLEAVFIAKEKGLKVPLVYNCGGYESMEALEVLDGVIDIYMPDMKYSDNNAAKKYSNAQITIPKDITIKDAKTIKDIIDSLAQ